MCAEAQISGMTIDVGFELADPEAKGELDDLRLAIERDSAPWHLA